MRLLSAALLPFLALAPLALGQPATEPSRDPASLVEDPSVLPAGPGQEETFYACTACHSSAIIRRSGFPRAQWDGLMDWMTEKHGMHPLAGEERRVIVDYLAQHFGPRQPASRARNPFLN